MTPITLEEGDGYLLVNVKLKDGTITDPIPLDLFEATNVYLALRREHPDVVPRATAWCEWLAEHKGLVGLSHGAALSLASQMLNAVDEYAKKKPGLGWETAESNASSGSPSSE